MRKSCFLVLALLAVFSSLLATVDGSSGKFQGEAFFKDFCISFSDRFKEVRLLMLINLIKVLYFFY